MFDTGLADRIRAKGVRVVEVAGWRTRGNSSGFAPRGAGHHHTAGSASGSAPSLRIIIDGRPDVPGPLAQVLQSRESNPWHDIAYVVAAGKANHGGVGTWTGNSGTMDSNYESEGLEVEHTGMSAVHEVRHEISARILAAMCEAPGSPRDPSMVWEHYEYARPLGRKVDFRYLTPYSAPWIRGRVGYWIGRTVTSQPPPPPPEEEDDMPYLTQSQYTGIYYHDGAGSTWISDTQTALKLLAQGVKLYDLGANEADARRIVESRVTNTDELILAQEQAQTMYAKAQTEHLADIAAGSPPVP